MNKTKRYQIKADEEALDVYTRLMWRGILKIRFGDILVSYHSKHDWFITTHPATGFYVTSEEPIDEPWINEIRKFFNLDQKRVAA